MIKKQDTRVPSDDQKNQKTKKKKNQKKNQKKKRQKHKKRELLFRFFILICVTCASVERSNVRFFRFYFISEFTNKIETFLLLSIS